MANSFLRTGSAPPSAAPTLRRITPADRAAGLRDEGLQALVNASQCLAGNRLDDAQKALDEVFAIAPEHAEALRLQGVILSARGRLSDAASVLKRALKGQPDDPMILNHLGALLHDTGDAQNGLAMLRRACELDPNLAAAWINLGRALEMDSQIEEASGAFQRALQCNPRHVPSRIGYANSLKATGHTDEAAAEFRRAIAIDPRAVRAWFGLAELKTVRLEPAEVAALERLYADPALATDDRAFAGFALGKALEDDARYADAFRVFSESNAIWRRKVQWSLPEFSALLQRFMDAFATPPAPAPDPTLGKEVIFVVSLPRSGSTLTEQILAAHSQIEGGGELSDLVAAIQEESARRGEAFPSWVPKMTPADWERLGKRYLELTAGWRKYHSIFTDKALTNWMFIGPALAMLPGARFVNCRRDPLETTWSCFKQLFGRNPHPFSYTLEEVGAYWRHYDELMAFWHARYPKKIYDQIYEDLLANPEQNIRRLLDFCGVDFERACLRYYQSRRTVRTASAAQVRQPLREDTARAKNYGELLDPLRRSLGLP